MRKIGNFIFILIIAIFVLMSFNLVIVSANSIVATEARRDKGRETRGQFRCLDDLDDISGDQV